MKLPAVPRLYRRAILIYVGTIVVPVAAFLWLGIRSFESQREMLVNRTNETLGTELKTQIRAAATEALEQLRRPGSPHHPIVQYPFAMAAGEIVRPALRAPLPDVAPPEFAEALQQEVSHPDQALGSYKALLANSVRPSLALQGIARCQARLGRLTLARETWRRLAAEYPDERDLSHQPYGIFAAMQAGDTNGLYEAIASGRWDLSGDQAAHFLQELDPRRTAGYLAQFEFARALSERFRPKGVLGDADIYPDEVGAYRIFYRSDGPDRIIGFSVNEPWVTTELTPAIERKLDVEGTRRRDLGVYAGSVALVLVILSAGVVMMLRDVSREARTNRARSELVSSVSHELKTPITLVRLYSETLLRHRGFSEDERVGFYRIIARESTRLGRLVDQVLTMSRVERGAQNYHFEEGDLAPVVSGVVEDYREYLEHAGFSLRHCVPDAVPPVRFDEAALSQAVLNLLDNAVKYSEQSREIDVRVQVGTGSVAIEVEDHGVGIAVSEQKRIFERFYRIANGNGKGGYGLGLFLVRHIIEAHGGRAEVESELGRGSLFRLILPTATAWPNTASSS